MADNQFRVLLDTVHKDKYWCTEELNIKKNKSWYKIELKRYENPNEKVFLKL